MSRHIYPRIGQHRLYPRKNGKAGTGAPCKVCGAPSTGRSHIEVSHMRGDDEVAPACDQHKNDADALLAAINTKVKP